jgi:hypothetical protein
MPCSITSEVCRHEQIKSWSRPPARGDAPNGAFCSIIKKNLVDRAKHEVRRPDTINEKM